MLRTCSDAATRQGRMHPTTKTGSDDDDDDDDDDDGNKKGWCVWMCLYAHTDVTCGFPPAVIAEILICNGLSTNSKRLDRVSRIWKGVKGSDKEEKGFISVNDTGSTRISNFRYLRDTCEVTSEPSTPLKSTYQYEIIVCANRHVGAVSRA